MKKLTLWIETLLGSWVTWVTQHAIWVISFFFLATLGLGYYTATHLAFHTDTQDMIDANLSWRKDYNAYKASFPGNHDTVVIVLEGKTYEQTRQASQLLYDALKKDPQYQSVSAFPLTSFFEKNKLLYMSEPALHGLEYRLPTITPLLSLKENQLAVFMDLLNESLKQSQTLEELKPFLIEWAQTLEENIQNQPHFVSWVPLFTPKQADPPLPIQIIEVKPTINYATLFPGKEVVQHIQDQFKALNLNQYQVKLKLTGEVVLAYEELLSVNKNMGWGALGSLVMVMLLLIAAFRSLKLVFVSLITLIFGLLMTAAFAAAAIGHLNMISVAFAILYIGLSIDFTIHLILHYQDKAQHSDSQLMALKHSFALLAPSLFFCVLTTMAGFYSFLPTTFKGVAELGLIAGTGMLISFLVNYSLLPALLRYVTLKAPIKSENRYSFIHKLQAIPFHHDKRVIGAFILFLVPSLFLTPFVSFNADPMSLRDEHQASVETYHELNDKLTLPLTFITVLTKDKAELKSIKEQLSQLPTVKKVVDLESFVPEHQSKKNQVIREIRNILSLPNALPRLKENNVTRNKQMQALNKHLKALPQTEVITNLTHAIEDYLTFLKDQPVDIQSQHWDNLAQDTLSGLVYQVQNLKGATRPDKIGIPQLPQDLQGTWHQEDVYRLAIYPKEDMNITANQVQFVEEVLSVAPHATGLPVIHEKAGQTIIEAFLQAFITAFVIITVLLFLLMRQSKQVLLALIPLLSACLLTTGMMVILGLPFNFANIIALPLLLGIGVDNGIHLVHRYYHASDKGADLMQSSTSKAVLISTLTTIFSFINLAFSSHYGMSSMGILLSVGMLCMLLCTLVLLPALLHLINGK